jgi:hypothetical protein
MKPKLVTTIKIYEAEVQRTEGLYELAVIIQLRGRKRTVRTELRSGPQSFWGGLFNSRQIPLDVRAEAEEEVLKEWKKV